MKKDQEKYEKMVLDLKEKAAKKLQALSAFLKQGHITTTYKKENSNNRPLIETKQPLHPLQANT